MWEPAVCGRFGRLSSSSPFPAQCTDPLGGGVRSSTLGPKASAVWNLARSRSLPAAQRWPALLLRCSETSGRQLLRDVSARETISAACPASRCPPDRHQTHRRRLDHPRPRPSVCHSPTPRSLETLTARLE